MRAVVHQGHAQAFRKAIRDRRSRLHRFEQPLFRPQTLGLVIARTFDREGWVTTDGVSHTAHRALSIPFSYTSAPDRLERAETHASALLSSLGLAGSLLAALVSGFRFSDGVHLGRRPAQTETTPSPSKSGGVPT